MSALTKNVITRLQCSIQMSHAQKHNLKHHTVTAAMKKHKPLLCIKNQDLAVHCWWRWSSWRHRWRRRRMTMRWKWRKIGKWFSRIRLHHAVSPANNYKQLMYNTSVHNLLALHTTSLLKKTQRILKTADIIITFIRCSTGIIYGSFTTI